MADTSSSKASRDLARAQTERTPGSAHGVSFDDLMNSRAPALPNTGKRGLLTTKEGLNDFIVEVLKDPNEKTAVKLQAAKQIAELNGIGSDEGGDLRSKTDQELFDLLTQLAPLMREFLRPPPNPLLDKKIQYLVKLAKSDPDHSVNIRDISKRWFSGNMVKAKKLVEQMFRFGLGKPAEVRRGTRGAPQKRFVFDWDAVERCEVAIQQIDPHEAILSGFQEPETQEPPDGPGSQEVA